MNLMRDVWFWGCFMLWKGYKIIREIGEIITFRAEDSGCGEKPKLENVLIEKTSTCPGWFEGFCWSFLKVLNVERLLYCEVNKKKTLKKHENRYLHCWHQKHNGIYLELLERKLKISCFFKVSFSSIKIKFFLLNS